MSMFHLKFKKIDDDDDDDEQKKHSHHYPSEKYTKKHAIKVKSPRRADLSKSKTRKHHHPARSKTVSPSFPSFSGYGNLESDQDRSPGSSTREFFGSGDLDLGAGESGAPDSRHFSDKLRSWKALLSPRSYNTVESDNEAANGSRPAGSRRKSFDYHKHDAHKHRKHAPPLDPESLEDYLQTDASNKPIGKYQSQIEEEEEEFGDEFSSEIQKPRHHESLDRDQVIFDNLSKVIVPPPKRGRPRAKSAVSHLRHPRLPTGPQSPKNAPSKAVTPPVYPTPLPLPKSHTIHTLPTIPETTTETTTFTRSQTLPFPTQVQNDDPFLSLATEAGLSPPPNTNTTQTRQPPAPSNDIFGLGLGSTDLSSAPQEPTISFPVPQNRSAYNRRKSAPSKPIPVPAEPGRSFISPPPQKTTTDPFASLAPETVPEMTPVTPSLISHITSSPPPKAHSDLNSLFYPSSQDPQPSSQPKTDSGYGSETDSVLNFKPGTTSEESDAELPRPRSKSKPTKKWTQF